MSNKGFGDFNAAAYDALREAYADQMSAPLEEENEGYNIQGQNYKLETVDARGEYIDKTGLWKYPDGTTEYEKPTAESLITSLQKGEDEDIDTLIDEILGEETNDEPTGHPSESATTEEEQNEETSE